MGLETERDCACPRVLARGIGSTFVAARCANRAERARGTDEHDHLVHGIRAGHRIAEGDSSAGLTSSGLRGSSRIEQIERRSAMTRQPSGALSLDYLIKVGIIHSMTGDSYRSVGLRGAEIVAVSAESDGLDDLTGPDTIVAEASDLTVLPAFEDAHEHLMEVSRNTLLVPVDRARSVEEFARLISDAAELAQPGQWIVTSMAWHESNLAENRMPTGAELDAAAPDHPVFARRGGHLAVASSAALRAAGVGPGTPDPPGGTIGRRPDGSPSGLLEGGAVYQVAAF